MKKSDIGVEIMREKVATREEYGIASLPLRMYMRVKDYKDPILWLEIRNESGYEMTYGNVYSLQYFDGKDWVDLPAGHGTVQTEAIRPEKENQPEEENRPKKENRPKEENQPEEITSATVGPVGMEDFPAGETVYQIADLETVEVAWDLSRYGSLATGRYKIKQMDLEAEFEITE